MKVEPILNQILAESSLSRVWNHTNNDDTFGIISAFKLDNYWVENIILHSNLKKEIKSKGYGFIELDSGYSYLDNTNEEISVRERSYFIPKITFKDITELGKKYEQETIIFKDNEFFILVKPDGTIEKTFLKGNGYNFKPENLKNAWSQFIRSKNKNAIKKFTFNVQERIIPSRTDSYKMLGENKGLAKVKYINLF